MQNDIENNTKNTQKNTENNTEKSIPDLLLKTGQEFYWCGILFIKIFLTALFVLITLMLIIEITADYPGKLSDCLTLNSSPLSCLYGATLTSIHDHWKNHSFDRMDLCWQSNVSAF